MERKKVILSILGITGILCVVFLPGYSELQKLREKSEQYQKRIKLLEEHNDDLKDELTRMKEDPEQIEKKARNKLGIVKKGEIIYRKNPTVNNTPDG